MPAPGDNRAAVLITPAEVARSKERLARFATAEGFTLGTIYVEHLDTAPAAFYALIDAAKRYEVTAVAVPSMTHLSAVGALSPLKDHLEQHTGARVLVVGGA